VNNLVARGKPVPQDIQDDEIQQIKKTMQSLIVEYGEWERYLPEASPDFDITYLYDLVYAIGNLLI